MEAVTPFVIHNLCTAYAAVVPGAALLFKYIIFNKIIIYNIFNGGEAKTRRLPFERHRGP